MVDLVLRLASLEFLSDPVDAAQLLGQFVDALIETLAQGRITSVVIGSLSGRLMLTSKFK